ncbi:hypothetical protein AVEN_22804-1 [Araneus ventricosus]|uniref:Uncharacterized protein n=1 Tax=Araneus ventricosus TaxID=182803 RepID=A0A4Y2EBW5_ARAVE|nr:hypothetical protein AVEN_22804-1 [Araneus ventricosus]
MVSERQSQESLDRIRAVNAAAYRRRTKAETPSQAQNRQEIHPEQQRLYIEIQTPAQSQTRREVNATVHNNRFEGETPAQSITGSIHNV